MTSYIYNMVDTWASGGGPYTSIKMNATDNDTGSASLLMDLQVGGTSKFSVRKDGFVILPGTGLGVSNIYTTGGGIIATAITGGFNFVSAISFASDTFVNRRAAANLRFGAADAAAPVAQTLSVQSVVAGTSNTAGTALTITGSQGTGTGAGGSIIFQVAPAGSSGSAQNALSQTALTIAPGAGAPVVTINATLFTLAGYANGSGWYGGSFGSESVALLLGTNGRVVVNASGSFAFGSSGISSPDTILYRDAANTLALRNGTAAQAFNIYNTYTSSTSFERYSVDWITTANLVIVGPNKGSGGGTQRVQRLSYLEDGGAGSTVPLLGSTCPAASGTVKSWIKVITSDGTTAYVPCWA